MFIFSLSTVGSVQLPESLISPDKIGHFIAYCVLTILVLLGLWKSNQLSSRTMILAIIISSGYGALLEVIQFSFFPDRYFELWDAFANIVGAVAGYYIFRKFQDLRHTNTDNDSFQSWGNDLRIWEKLL